MYIEHVYCACIATNGQLKRIICVYLYNELHAMFDFQSAGSTACIKTTRYDFFWLDEYSYEILKVCLQTISIKIEWDITNKISHIFTCKSQDKANNYIIVNKMYKTSKKYFAKKYIPN